MKGNKLIKRIKALQRAAGHDIEIGFEGLTGFRDIMIQPRIVSCNNVTIPFAAISFTGDCYRRADAFMTIALNNRIDIFGNPRCNITDDEKIFMTFIAEQNER